MKKLGLLLIGILTLNMAVAQCVANFSSSQNPICQDQTVTFTDLSSGATGVVSWSWNFGSGAVPATSISQTPPAVSYTTPGVKTVTLTYSGTGGGGCSSTVSQTVTVNVVPTASFTSTAPQCTGSMINFTNTGSAGAEIVYNWAFGAGATPGTSTAQSPSGITYSSAGSSSVTETVTNTATGCSASATNAITINQTPTASFTSNAPQCTGSTVTFTNTGTTGVGETYSWTFAGGAPATSVTQNQNVTFAASGAKTITLTTTTTASGCTATSTQNININQTPTANFTGTFPSCAGSNVNFVNTGTVAGVNWAWSFGPGSSPSTSTAQTPTGIVYSTSGTPSVSLITTNPSTGCSASHVAAITINATPAASFTSNAPECTGNAVNFTNTGTTGAGESYSWTFAGGAPATSATQNQNGVTWATAGTQTITLTTTTTATGCSSISTQTIQIDQTPTASFTSTAPQCTGSAVSFTNTGSSGANIVYNWNFGPGASPSTSTAQNPTGITFSTAGAITVTETVTNSLTGCSASESNIITINQTPSSLFTSNAPQCTGSAVNFTNTGTTGLGETYNWTFSGGAPATSTTQNQNGVTWAAAGAQTVTLVTTTTATGCSSSTTQVININQAPMASFTSTAPQCTGSAVTFNNTGTAGIDITYSWDFGAGATPATSTTQNPASIIYSSSGSSTVTETITNTTTGCSASASNAITINQTPTTAFTSNAPQCTGSAVNFTNTGTTGVGETYNWTFSGGAPATSATQNQNGVTWASAGAQTITLVTTTTATGCSSTAVQTININQTPIATFTSNAPQCVGNSVNFTNTGSTGSGVTYSWDFGLNASPSTSTSESPTGIVYTTPGNKLVTFSVNNGTCTAVDTMTIVIDSTTVASFTSNAPRCTGDSVNFSSTGSSGSNITYSWNFGPNAVPLTSTVQNPTGVLFSTSGAQTITLTVTNTTSHCSSSTTQNININEAPIATFTSNAPQCVGNSVNFTNTGSSGSGVTYSWDFGLNASPSTSTSESTTGVVYTTPGNKLVTFSVNNGACTAVDTMTIVIDTTTVASFTSNAPRCTGDSVNFTSTGSSGSNITYNWNFGPNALPLTSTLQNPTGVLFSTSGAQTITLMVTNTTSHCSSSITQNININQTPVAKLTSNAPQCVGNSINFTNTGSTGSGVTYSWDFGLNASPATSTSESTTGVVYTTPGNKLVTFSVNNGTCTAVDTMTIVIDTTTVASFTSNAPRCTGDSVNFTSTGSSGSNITYSWNFGPNAVPLTSTLQNPTGVLFSTSGAQTITLMVTNTTSHCSSSTTQNININQTPTATFTSTAPQCVGNSVNFTNTGTSGSGVTYSWDFGLNASPATSTSESTAGVVYTTPGNKLVTFSVNNGTCTAVDTMTIVIDTTTVASFTSNAPRCTGDSVNFTSTGSSGSNITYSWNFGPNAVPLTSTLQNPTGVLFSTSGAQTITLMVTNTTSHCSSSTTQNININQTPVAKFTSNAPQCVGNSINFTNTGSTGSGVTYSWDFGLNSSPTISTAENPTGIAYSSGGWKLVTLNVSNGVCSATDTTSIAVDSLPLAKAGNDTTICAGDSVKIGTFTVAGYTYKWSPSTGLSSAIVSNPTVHPSTGANTYVLTVTNTLGCSNTDTVTVTMLAPLIADAGQTVSICRGDSVKLGYPAITGQIYTWNTKKGLNDSIIAMPTASPDSTVTYTLTVTGWGCKPAKDQVTVTVNQLPHVTAGPDDTIAIGSSVELNAAGAVQYIWSPAAWLSNAGVANPIANPDSTITYIVIGTDIFGCSNSDTITIHVLSNAYWAPTAFTPNGDGRDDIFYIHGYNISNFEFGVYNRWGEQIFHTQDISQGWDGRRQATREEMPDGAYVYYVRGVLPNGQAIDNKGMVNLIR